jgi:hypothetical protein
MSQQLAKHAFDQADKLLRDLPMPTNLQAVAGQSVIASRKIYDKGAAVAQDGAKAVTEIAEAAWSSTKMLNEKVAQNLTANFEATFAAAHAIAAARSLPEMAKLQSDFIRRLTAQSAAQTKEFLDLSTRASQHVLEKVQSAAAKPFKP